MRHDPPDPPEELGVREGLAYALFRPEGRPRGGVLILHGAGSAKESHFDFARACRAEGLAALAYDARGHGDSDNELDGRLVDDAVAMASLLPTGPVALRGSSLGGYVALLAAAPAGADAVVAICPASGDQLGPLLRADDLGFRADRPALQEFVAAHDVRRAVFDLTVPLLLLHAEGDESVPIAQSESLLTISGSEVKRLVRQPGGHHRSIQHDGELQGLSLRFLRRALGGA